MRGGDQDAVARGGPCEVVEELQAGVVRLVEVVDHEHRTLTGGSEPQQLGRRHVQALVAAASVPLQVPSREGAPELVLRGVLEAVQESGVATAQVRQRLEHGCVRPWRVHGCGGARADAHPEGDGPALEVQEDRRGADPLRAGHEERLTASLAHLGQEPLEAGDLTVPADHALAVPRQVCGRTGPVDRGVESLTQGDDGAAGPGAELTPQLALESFHMAQRRGQITGGGRSAGELDVRLLVGGFGAGEVRPAAGQSQCVSVEHPQPFPGFVHPRVVPVVGEQVAVVEVGCGAGGLGVLAAEGVQRRGLERDGVHVDVLPGQQVDQVPAEHHGPCVTQGATRVVGGLVQPWAGVRDRDVRPQRVHHLLAVQVPARGECEELDQLRCVAARPRPGVDLVGVDAHLEAPQERDPDPHRHPPSTAHDNPGAPRGIGIRRRWRPPRRARRPRPA